MFPVPGDDYGEKEIVTPDLLAVVVEPLTVVTMTSTLVFPANSGMRVTLI